MVSPCHQPPGLGKALVYLASEFKGVIVLGWEGGGCERKCIMNPRKALCGGLLRKMH